MRVFLGVLALITIVDLLLGCVAGSSELPCRNYCPPAGAVFRIPIIANLH